MKYRGQPKRNHTSTGVAMATLRTIRAGAVGFGMAR